ncbi:MAG: DUF5606 domain-containing protein [Rikenellaceae bacterium]
MKLKEILAIAGQPGLYKYVAQASRGLIIESLKDGKRSNVSGHSNVSSLAEISMFTEGEDIALAEVFTRLYAITEGKESISHKESGDVIRKEFEKVLPEYDRDRVHLSDMKKCFAWFNILVGAGATSFDIEDPAAEAEE